MHLEVDEMDLDPLNLAIESILAMEKLQTAED